MGLSVWQILIIAAVVLLLFGANRIPRMMRDMGSGITQFKKGLKDGESGDDGDGDDAKTVDTKPAIESKSGAPDKNAKDKTVNRA